MNFSVYSANGRSYKDQKSYRQALDADGFTNAYKPWSRHDDEKLIRLNQSMSIDDLAQLFKRKRGAIFCRLRKLNDDELINQGVSLSASNPLLALILKGIHPITGEILSEDSAWKHPAIIQDLKDILRIFND